MTDYYGLKDRMLSVRFADVSIASYIVLSVVYDDGSTPAKVARVLLVASAVFESTVKPLRANLVQLWQALFVIYSATSIFWAFSGDRAQQMALTLLINAVCIVSLVYLVEGDPARLRLSLVCFMIAPIVLMARIAVDNGLFVFITAREAGDTNANIIGMTAAFGFGLAYMSWSQSALVSRWFAGVALAGNIAVAALSASRKAVIMVALIVLLFSLLNSSFRGLRRVLRIVTAGVLGVAGYFLLMNFAPLYDLVGHRMETMMNGFLSSGEVDASTSTRFSLIERGVGWFREAPWIGHGVDNFRALMAMYYPREFSYYAHNNFVELLVNGGVVGLVAFYWLYVVIIVRGFKLRSAFNSTQSMILTLMVTLILIEYGAIDYYSRIFMAFVGLAWVALCTDTGRENFGTAGIGGTISHPSVALDVSAASQRASRGQSAHEASEGRLAK